MNEMTDWKLAPGKFKRQTNLNTWLTGFSKIYGRQTGKIMMMEFAIKLVQHIFNKFLSIRTIGGTIT